MNPIQMNQHQTLSSELMVALEEYTSPLYIMIQGRTDSKIFYHYLDHTKKLDIRLDKFDDYCPQEVSDNYVKWFKTLTQKQKNNIKRNVINNEDSFWRGSRCLNKIPTNKKFLEEMFGYREPTKNMYDGGCDFEENPFYQLTFIQRDYNNETITDRLEDYNKISTYLTHLELSFKMYSLEHRQSNQILGDDQDLIRLAIMWEASIKIQRCYRKWVKPRKDAVRKIEEKFLDAYWSPRTEMGRRHINRLYDDNLE